MWTCSIYTKSVTNPETENISDNILYTKCHNFAFLPLTQQLVTICNQKNYPFFLLATDKSRSPLLLLCTTHRNMILNGPLWKDFNGDLTEFDTSETMEFISFLDEYFSFLNDFPTSSPSTAMSDMNIQNKEGVEEEYDMLSSPDFHGILNRYVVHHAVHDSDLPVQSVEQKEKTGSMARVKFENLPAIALRRYKRFFKLPNRSGASSRTLLLDGMNEHFNSLASDPSEIIANYLRVINANEDYTDTDFDDESTHYDDDL